MKTTLKILSFILILTLSLALCSCEIVGSLLQNINPNTEKDDSVGGKPSELEFVGARLIFVDENGTYLMEPEFYVKNGTTFGELIKGAFGLEFDEFAAMCVSIEAEFGGVVDAQYTIDRLMKFNLEMKDSTPEIICTHDWDVGFCRLCRIICWHIIKNGKCTVCKYEEPKTYTVRVSHKRDHIESYEYEGGIMLSEFIYIRLVMSFDSFTTDRMYTMWVNGEKVVEDILLLGDVDIVYVDYSVADEAPDMCYKHKWTDGVCNMCKKVCEHRFSGDTCEICGLVSGGIDNPITVHFNDAEIPVPYSATFFDVVALYMTIDTDVEMSFINNEWAVDIDGERMTVGAYECPRDYGRDVWLVYLGDSNPGGDGYPDGGDSGSNPLFVYVISIIDDPAYVPFTIESDVPLSGDDIIQRAGITNPECFYIYVNNSELYDLDSFRLMIFTETTNIDFHLAVTE